MVSQSPFYLVVGSDSPIATLYDYIATATGSGIEFVGAGPGSMAHVAQLTLDNNLGITAQYIPTKGGGDIATEINGGRADGHDLVRQISEQGSAGVRWQSCRTSVRRNTPTSRPWRNSDTTPRSRSGSVSSRSPELPTTS